MNPTLILQAQQRKAQIKNNGTVEQLREVLKAVGGEGLPFDPVATYHTLCDDGRFSAYYTPIALPILNVTDFYHPSFTWGQEVMVGEKKLQFVALNPRDKESAILIDHIGFTHQVDMRLIPSKITPEQAAGEMVEMLNKVMDIPEVKDILLLQDDIRKLLNRIQP